MNTSDFRFMSQGRVVAPLRLEEAGLLAPVDIRGAGQGRALLMLHGFSSSPAVFRVMLPQLKGYDALLCPVLPGHGDSIAVFAHTPASAWLSYVETLCGDLIETYEQVDVLGFSLGGLLACHLSQRFKLNRLYLLAPALVIHLPLQLTRLLAYILRALGVRRLNNRAGNLYTTHYPELVYSQLPIATIIEMLTLIKDTPRIIPTCPVDLFLGRMDEVVDSQAVADYFESNARVKTHWLAHSAHILPLDGDIEAIVACINHQE